MTLPARADEPRHCIKCGREVGPDDSLCEVCNRAGMATPSATQYHGTIVAAIVLAVAGLAVAASLSLRGVGPYAAEVTAVTPADPGWSISYLVTNEGTRAGRAKCQVVAYDEGGDRLRARTAVTVQIGAGESVEQTQTIPGLEVEPTTASVTCDT